MKIIIQGHVVAEFGGVISTAKAAEIATIELNQFVAPEQVTLVCSNMSEVRQIRDELLRQSDKTQLVDAPYTAEKKQAWATYRQQLRDIPEQTSDLINLVWPLQPE